MRQSVLTSHAVVQWQASRAPRGTRAQLRHRAPPPTAASTTILFSRAQVRPLYTLALKWAQCNTVRSQNALCTTCSSGHHFAHYRTCVQHATQTASARQWSDAFSLLLQRPSSTTLDAPTLNRLTSSSRLARTTPMTPNWCALIRTAVPSHSKASSPRVFFFFFFGCFCFGVCFFFFEGFGATAAHLPRCVATSRCDASPDTPLLGLCVAS